MDSADTRQILRGVGFEVTLFVVIGFVAMQFSWFGTSELIDRHTLNLLNQIFGAEYGCPSEDAAGLAHRAVSRALALGGPPSDESSTRLACGPADEPEVAHAPGQQLITVVTLSDEDLADAGEIWPATYLYHANVLEEIARLEPEAIFVDIHFGDQHGDDETIEYLVERIEEIERGEFLADPEPGATETALPPKVWLAGDPAGCGEGIRKELTEPNPRRVVLAPRASDTEDLHDRTYPLSPHSGHPSPCGVESIAARAYREMSERNAPEDATPRDIFRPLDDRLSSDMVVVWGNRSPAINLSTLDCKYDKSWYDLFVERINGLPSEFKSRCPYHATIPASLLENRVGTDTVRRFIRGRYVLYGVDRLYSYDHVVPPTHVEIPAVHLHAMALDNLVTFGEGYIHEEDARETAKVMMLIVMLLVLAIGRSLIKHRGEIFDLLFSRFGRRRRQQLRPAPASPSIANLALIGLAAALTTALAVVVLVSLLSSQLLSQVIATQSWRWAAAGSAAVVGLGLVAYIWRDPWVKPVLNRAMLSLASVAGLVVVLMAIIRWYFVYYAIVPVDAVGIVIAALLSLTSIYTSFEVRAQSLFSRYLQEDGTAEQVSEPHEVHP